MQYRDIRFRGISTLRTTMSHATSQRLCVRTKLKDREWHAEPCSQTTKRLPLCMCQKSRIHYRGITGLYDSRRKVRELRIGSLRGSGGIQIECTVAGGALQRV